MPQVRTFAQMGIKIPQILLPNDPSDPRWPCVACDQYTSQPEIWQKLEQSVGESPSALRLILPEAYLSQTEQRLPAIHKAMERYLDTVLTTKVDGFVLSARTTQSGTRLGLVLAVDLEAYSYEKGSRSKIRATEGTILSRIPPRVRIRENAKVECSHILLLANDKKHHLLRPLYQLLKETAALYDTDLPVNGGHIKGWRVEGELLAAAQNAFSLLYDEAEAAGDPFLAVGDGNHSLATAKAVWEKRKAAGCGMDDPSRYALCEVTNLYDTALFFEPIHRALFGTGMETIKAALLNAGYAATEATPYSRPAANEALLCHGQDALLFTALPLKELQAILDELVQNGGISSIDYIHGDEEALQLGGQQENVAILLPPMEKLDLFPSIANGPLPRKAFSMGEANEKRYYMEARRILP